MMTFEKHLLSVSRAASQRLGILRKSWREFHDRSLLGRQYPSFVLLVFEYCSAVWCSAADIHLKLLERTVSGSQFLTGGMFKCDVARHRSVAVRCMLYKIRWSLVHPLNGALPEHLNGALPYWCTLSIYHRWQNTANCHYI